MERLGTLPVVPQQGVPPCVTSQLPGDVLLWELFLSLSGKIYQEEAIAKPLGAQKRKYQHGHSVYDATVVCSRSNPPYPKLLAFSHHSSVHAVFQVQCHKFP